MKIPPVGSLIVPSKQKGGPDGPTEKTKQAVVFRSFANESVNFVFCCSESHAKPKYTVWAECKIF